jgi:hypothetical protein
MLPVAYDTGTNQEEVLTRNPNVVYKKPRAEQVWACECNPSST